jgi:large subunit ribosomal protein L6
MSRIGKQPVAVPAGVKVAVQGRKVSVSGPQGTLTMETRPEITVKANEAEKNVAVSVDPKFAQATDVNAYWGTTRAHINNMMEGVTKGYEKILEVVGVGWSAAVQGKNLKLVVGYANPILVPIPEGLKVTVEKQFIRVSGPDIQRVGQFSAEVRSKRKPEPYNGKGIKYTTETIKRKQGKQFGA